MAVKRLLSLQLVTVLALTVLVVGGSRLGVPARSAPVPFEVWLIDQSDTTGLGYGGTLRIYSGADLTGSNPSAAAPTDVIDLGAETAALCRARTGADPVRPHMVTFNNADTHAGIAFVASGHVAILDAVTRRPLACVRTEAGAGGARQAHALWPTEDDRYLVVANQNGKKLERIRTDYAANAFVQEPEATLDLANCTTPNGLPCQAPETRPDNAPICPFIASDNGPVFVSLRGGGLFAVDWRTTPMSIVAEYDRDNIPANGCGFIEARGMVFGDGGGGTAANLDQFSVWRLPMTGYSRRAALRRRLAGPGRPRERDHQDGALRLDSRPRRQRRRGLRRRDRRPGRHGRSHLAIQRRSDARPVRHLTRPQVVLPVDPRPESTVRGPARLARHGSRHAHRPAIGPRHVG